MEKIETLDFNDKPKKKGKFKKFLIILVLIILIGELSFYFLYNNLLSSVSNDSKKVEFVIEEGMSVYSVGEKLEKENLIKNNLAYKLYVKLNKITGYKAGTYILSYDKDVKEIVKILQNKAKMSDIVITFKEGKTITGIADIIEKNTKITKEQFLSKIKDETYINGLIEKYWFLTEDIKSADIYYPLEGYLFPDTYNFSNSVNEEEIITTMLNQTDKILSKFKDNINNSSYSVNEIVTMASLIEKEGIYKEDRKKIAGVFYNRLKKNMSLGSDVTTYYAFKVEIGSSDLTNEQINTYNPYNTRGPKMEGKLPVGAISNFGEESFEAAVNPELNDYLYFVADKNGKTYFAKTYNEHQQVIKELKANGNWLEF